eukprot:TRINITY_DN19630_c0_g1_i1.p1 TRINITY_DN19630_c0_g1~~TRINITY_DN19630_c0_g1_i1.p1  ORF type:complete len:339 (-),score=83.57 TRINITY_DN19630_c0_g1_i1:816-1721(-)
MFTQHLPHNYEKSIRWAIQREIEKTQAPHPVPFRLGGKRAIKLAIAQNYYGTRDGGKDDTNYRNALYSIWKLQAAEVLKVTEFLSNQFPSIKPTEWVCGLYLLAFYLPPVPIDASASPTIELLEEAYEWLRYSHVFPKQKSRKFSSSLWEIENSFEGCTGLPKSCIIETNWITSDAEPEIQASRHVNFTTKELSLASSPLQYKPPLLDSSKRTFPLRVPIYFICHDEEKSAVIVSVFNEFSCRKSARIILSSGVVERDLVGGKVSEFFFESGLLLFQAIEKPIQTFIQLINPYQTQSPSLT